MKLPSVVLLASALAAPAFAAEGPKNPCEQPTIPDIHASELVTKLFNRRGIEYKKCMDQFIEEQRNIYKQATDAAKSNAAFEAAEDAAKEYNAFVEKVNARNERLSQ